MPWNSGLFRLRDLLAFLYRDKPSATEIAVKAGLPLDRIELTNAAASNWFYILEEADRRDLISALVKTACDDFPNRCNELTEAIDEYRAQIPTGATSSYADPLDTFAILLDEPDDWIKVRGDEYIRHRHSPLFVIKRGSVESEDFREPWARKFPDPHATSFRVEYWYGSTLLKESLFVTTDGGRFTIPAPQLRDLDPSREDYESIEFSISLSSIEWKTAMLFNQYSDLRDRLPRIGVRLVE